MERRTAALIVALLVSPGCFEAPPDASDDDAGSEVLSAFDACVELLTAAAAADCASDCGSAWCDADICSSMTQGEIVDACNAVEVVGEPAFARDSVDACLADVQGDPVSGEGQCYFVMGICSAAPELGPRCSDACNALGIFEACLESDGCRANTCD